jgi:hypothetical protein
LAASLSAMTYVIFSPTVAAKNQRFANYQHARGEEGRGMTIIAERSAQDSGAS